MSPRIHVVQRVEHRVELREVGGVEQRVLDVRVVRGHTEVCVEATRGLGGDHGLGLAHVLRTEQELPVEIGHVDRVQIDQLIRESALL